MAKLLSYCCNSPAAINYHLVGDRHFCQKCREPCNIYEVEDTVTFGSEKVEQSWEKEFNENFAHKATCGGSMILDTKLNHYRAIKSFLARIVEQEKEKARKEAIASVIEFLESAHKEASEEAAADWTKHCSCLACCLQCIKDGNYINLIKND